MLNTEKEWFIKVPWGKLCVLAWGECYNPPVLLCHGEFDTAASFRPLLALLPDKFYYVAMEFPGQGRSNPFPPGLPINAHDMTYALVAVVKHFRWDNFSCIAHSIGALYATIFNLSYPGKMRSLVQLDPTPVYSNILEPEEFAQWYTRYFTEYYDNYKKFNQSKKEAVKYRKEKALQLLMSKRGLPKQIAADILERMTECVDGSFLRFTHDPRTELITRPATTHTLSRNLYTNEQTHTLAIVAETSIKNGSYDKAPHVLDNKAHNGNYRCVIVDGTHEVHVLRPELVAPSVSQFLIYGLQGVDRKAKL